MSRTIGRPKKESQEENELFSIKIDKAAASRPAVIRPTRQQTVHNSQEHPQLHIPCVNKIDIFSNAILFPTFPPHSTLAPRPPKAYPQSSAKQHPKSRFLPAHSRFHRQDFKDFPVSVCEPPVNRVISHTNTRGCALHLTHPIGGGSFTIARPESRGRHSVSLLQLSPVVMPPNCIFGLPPALAPYPDIPGKYPLPQPHRWGSKLSFSHQI